MRERWDPGPRVLPCGAKTKGMDFHRRPDVVRDISPRNSFPSSTLGTRGCKVEVYGLGFRAQGLGLRV